MREHSIGGKNWGLEPLLEKDHGILILYSKLSTKTTPINTTLVVFLWTQICQSFAIVHEKFRFLHRVLVDTFDMESLLVGWASQGSGFWISTTLDGARAFTE